MGRPNVGNQSSMNVSKVETMNQPANAAAGLKAATTLVGVVANSTILLPTLPAADVGVLPPGGRNVTITTVDGDASITAARWKFTGRDQFDREVVEYLPSETTTQAGAATLVGTKIFQKLDKVEPVVLTGNGAGDTYSLGWGSKVGLPVPLSSDFREIKSAAMVNAAGTTQTQLARTATNFDNTYHAIMAAAFGGAVTNGDYVAVQLRHDEWSPDDLPRI